MVFESNPRRDAWATIAGFIFQVNTTIVRWLNLQEGEVLELERGEDIDIVQAEFNDGVVNADRVLEQTKRRTSAVLTLKSPEALEAIANFAEHRNVNPNLRLNFRYVTTASVGIEHSWPGEKGGIPTWEAIRHGELSDNDRRTALDAIREFLLQSDRPVHARGAWKHLQGFLSSADNEALTHFIRAFEWSASVGDYQEIEAKIKTTLLNLGYRDSEGGSQQLFERLFVRVFRRLAQQGLKQLNKDELLAEVHQTSISDVDHALFQFITSQVEMLSSRLSKVEQEVEKLAAMQQSISAIVDAEGVAISLTSPDQGVIFDRPELVPPAIKRHEAIRTIRECLTQKTLTVIVGEPGSGKTHLCLLTAEDIKASLVWISIPRGSGEVQACMTLDRAVELITGSQRQNLSLKEWYSEAARVVRGKLVVLDDIPRMLPGSALARRVETLANCLEKEAAKLLATSFHRLPTIAAGFCEVDAPRLAEAEIVELLELYGGPPGVTKGLAGMLGTVTQGLVVLAVAAALYCSAQKWRVSRDQLEGLLRGDFSKSLKHDSKALVELTVPDPDARALLYRLSLAIGGFSRNTAERVAAVPPRIVLPGEKLDRLVGLWIQPFVADKFIQSPLLDSSLGSYLDQRTKAGVHAALGFETLRGRTLDPLQVITCIHHFNAAGMFNQAALILIQALLALTEDTDVFERDWGLSSLWATTPLPPEVDINLRLYARALQAVALEMMGRPIESTLRDIEQLVADAGPVAWGTVIASAFLAIRLYRRFPQVANHYLITALHGFGAARLPGGNAIPKAKGPALEGLLWATAHAATSDEDVESWIDAAKQLSKEEVQRLAESELASDNATILTDGIWLREYKKAGEKDWTRVEALVTRLEKLGAEINLPILRVAAIRTLIMLRAEFLNDIDGAVRLAETELAKIKDDESIFLIVEVTGRQLSYAKRSAAAIRWLKRARSIPVKGNSLWRRNVLITLAGEEGTSDARLAVGYIREALDLSRAEHLQTYRIIEVLAEYALALWKTGDGLNAFIACDEAVRLLFSCDESDPYWKKLFLASFGVAYYLSSMTFNGRAPSVPNYQPPRQGQFLGLDNVDTSAFVPAQKAFLRMKMAMFADAVGQITQAGQWALDALAVAGEIAGARTIYSLAWLDIVPAILRGNYAEASRIAMLMADSGSPNVAALEEGGFKNSEERERIQKLLDDPRKRTWVMMYLALASVCRLATLQIEGTSAQDISAAIEGVAKGGSGDLRIESIARALRAVLLEDHEWRELRSLGEFLRETESASSLVYFFGSALKRPLAQALNMQVWVAEHTEKFFSGFQSLRQAIVWHFYSVFWLDAVSREPEQFRTAERYTRRQVDAFAADISLQGVKRLLLSMSFCLGVDLPDSAKEWLEAS